MYKIYIQCDPFNFQLTKKACFIVNMPYTIKLDGPPAPCIYLILYYCIQIIS